MGTRGYLLSKVAQAFFTLVFVVVVKFFLFRVIPGNPAQILARNKLEPASAVQEKIRDFGLDKPLFPQQFINYVGDTVRFNLGTSYQTSQPVKTMIAERFWKTVLLLGVSTICATVLGVIIGIFGAWRRGSAFDIGSLGFSLITYAMPEFWLGLMLLLLFAVIFPIFPSGGANSPPNLGYRGISAWYDVGRHMFLPTLTLTLAYIGEYALIMRSSLLDVMGEEFVQTARAKGLRDAQVRNLHAVPNALLPTITLIALNLGFIISGAITIETVFSWPGLGLLSFQALSTPDFPVLQGLFLFFSVAVIIANLIADIMYSYLDPRVRNA